MHCATDAHDAGVEVRRAHTGERRRVQRRVVVQEDHHIAGGGPQTGVARAGEPPAGSVGHHDDARRRMRSQFAMQRVVAVDDHDQFVADTELGHH